MIATPLVGLWEAVRKVLQALGAEGRVGRCRVLIRGGDTESDHVSQDRGTASFASRSRASSWRRCKNRRDQYRGDGRQRSRKRLPISSALVVERDDVVERLTQSLPSSGEHCLELSHHGTQILELGIPVIGILRRYRFGPPARIPHPVQRR